MCTWYSSDYTDSADTYSAIITLFYKVVYNFAVAKHRKSSRFINMDPKERIMAKILTLSFQIKP
jgi:hypothetical protein